MRHVRARLGLTQDEVGRKVGVSAVQVSNYEHDRQEMPYARMLAFCEYFQISTNWLMCQQPMNHIALRGAK